MLKFRHTRRKPNILPFGFAQQGFVFYHCWQRNKFAVARLNFGNQRWKFTMSGETAEMRKQITGLMHELCQSFVERTVTRLWICLSRNAMVHAKDDSPSQTPTEASGSTMSVRIWSILRWHFLTDRGGGRKMCVLLIMTPTPSVFTPQLQWSSHPIRVSEQFWKQSWQHATFWVIALATGNTQVKQHLLIGKLEVCVWRTQVAGDQILVFGLSSDMAGNMRLLPSTMNCDAWWMPCQMINHKPQDHRPKLLGLNVPHFHAKDNPSSPWLLSRRSLNARNQQNQSLYCRQRTHLSSCMQPKGLHMMTSDNVCLVTVCNDNFLHSMCLSALRRRLLRALLLAFGLRPQQFLLKLHMIVVCIPRANQTVVLR